MLSLAQITASRVPTSKHLMVSWNESFWFIRYLGQTMTTSQTGFAAGDCGEEGAETRVNLSAAFPASSNTAVCLCVCLCEDMAEDRWHVILSSSPCRGAEMFPWLSSHLFNKQHSPEKFLETSMVVKMAPCGEKGHFSCIFWERCKKTFPQLWAWIKGHAAFYRLLIMIVTVM